MSLQFACGHPNEPQNRHKDRGHFRCKRCQNAANEKARAKRLAKLKSAKAAVNAKLDVVSRAYTLAFFSGLLEPKAKRRRASVRAGK